MPVTDVYGIWLGWIMFSMRTAIGSRPTARAISSIIALDREAGTRTADAAVRADRRLVGRDGPGARAKMRDRIGAREATRRHVGFLIGTLRPHAIGAGIDGDLAIDAEDVTLPIGIRRDPVMMVARMRAGQQMFVAILDPAHGMVEFQRQRGQDDLLGIQPRLGSKATADIGRDNPDAAFLDPEDFAERDAHRMRRLGRGIDHDLVEAVVAIRQHAAAFH